MMKKIYLIILILILTISSLFSQNPQVKIGDIVAGVGVVQVPFEMLNFTQQVNSFTFKITFNSTHLQFISLNDIIGFYGTLLTQQNGNTLTILYYDVSGYQPNGKIFDLTFNYNANVSTTIDFQATGNEVTYSVMPIPNIIYTNGSVGPYLNYMITTTSNPTVGGTTSGGGAYTNGQSCTVNATPNSGYAFANWTENGSQVSANPSYSFSVSANRTLVANFTQNPVNYTITTSSNPIAGGTTSGGGAYQNGQSCTLLATPNSGYTFTNWTEGSSVVSNNTNYTFTVSGNRTLIANFTESISGDAIQLNPGWNLISLDVIPLDAAVSTVFSSLIASNNLVEVKGFHGQQEVVFKPSNPSGNNTLSSLIAGMGYWVKVNAATVLTVEGSAIPEDFAINLNAGWNLIGYWPQQSVSVTESMEQLINAGIFEGCSGFETEGKFYDPEVPTVLNTLETVSNSKGYWIKVSSNFNNFKYIDSTSLNDGLVAYYPFNGNAQDESGNGNHGVLNGATLTEDRFGNSGSAYNFAGISNPQTIMVPHSTSLEFSDAATFSFWVNMNDYQGMDGWGSTTDYGYHVIFAREWDAYMHAAISGIPDGRFQSFFGSGANGIGCYDTVPGSSLNSWHHIVYVIKSSNVSIYANGNMIASEDGNSSFSSSNNKDLWFGRLIETWYPFNGKMDDIRIYNRALSPSEISELYHEGGWPLPDLNDGLVAYYPFNGNTQDESGTGNNGTIIGNISMTTDRFGNANSAYDFPGLPFNYINVPHSESLSLDTMTLVAWIYTETDYGYGQIIQKNRDIASGHYGLYTTSINGTVSYGNSVYAFVNEQPATGSWHMVAGILYGNIAKFYVDGILMADTIAPSTFIYSGNQPLAIGMHYFEGVPDFFTYPYKGKLDDLRIYNRVLSSSEIQALYSLEQSFVCGQAFTDPRDSRTYNTVLIGDQCWMKENLSYLPVVSPPNQGSENDPYYYVYNYQGTDINEAKATENYQNYGVLYNWPASLASCPTGWHLPSYTEWTNLTNFLIAQGFPNTNDPLGAGNALKSCRQIESPLGGECSTLNHPRWGSDATHYGFDEFGFSALPNGIYDPSGAFSHIGSRGYFWTSTEDSPSGVKIQAIFNWDSEISRGNIGKSAGMSIRCVKNIQDQASIPTINTTEVTGITESTATSGGIIISDGGTPVSARGLCFNTSGNPTIDDGCTSNDSGSDSFSNTLTGLNPETTYYLRAYATNAAGTAYGNIISFTTEPAPFNCGVILTDSRDDKTYATVKIGNQCWMQTNLKTGTLLSLPNYPSDNNTIERWALNNDTNIGDTYGSFYTWNELMNYKNNESNQGICPDGWHIPSLDEFNVLINLYGGTSLAGGAMKHNGESGFNATMLGMVDFNPSFYGANFSSFYWTSTPADNGAYNISVLQSGPSVFIQNSTPQTGYLAKCLKNPCTAPTSANAGPDQTNLPSTTTQLAANTPIIGNGIWSITEGDGGSVDEVSNPVSNFSGISGTTYKLAWTITNTCGDISVDTVFIHFPQNLNIGESYGGGIIAYIFQQGDPDYIEGEQHGLIAASIDQGDAQWYVTSYPYITYPPTGATANTLGTGNANTTAIVGIQGIGNYAAKLCYDLVLEGYSDWYLPSKDELGKLYINKSAIGGFSYTAAYWSSSESIVSADNAWFQHFSDGSWYDYIKYNACNIRAVRNF